MPNRTSRPHWSRGGHSLSPRRKAIPNVTAQADRPQAARIENGGSMVSRNFDCGQVRPQAQAVNTTSAMPSVWGLSRPRLGLTDVDTDLAGGQRRVGAHREMDAIRRHVVPHDRAHHADGAVLAGGGPR